MTAIFGLAPFDFQTLNSLSLGALSDLPVIGRLLFSHSILTYLALACAILMSLYLNRSRRGLNLRAIGENPAAADAMGVPVSRYKYLHILLGGGLSGTIQVRRGDEVQPEGRVRGDERSVEHATGEAEPDDPGADGGSGGGHPLSLVS